MQEIIINDDDEEKPIFTFQPADIDPDNFNANTEFIKLNKINVIKLLQLVPPTEDNFIYGVAYLLEYTYLSLDTIVDLLKNWSGNEEYITHFVEQNRHNIIREDSNKWFFKILDRLQPRQKDQILEKYFNNTLDDSVNINIEDPITLETMMHTDYNKFEDEGFQIGKFMTDLKQVAVYILHENKYFIKIKKEDQRKCDIQQISVTQFKKLLNQIYIGNIYNGKRKQKITGLKIFESGNNQNYIMKREMKFYSENNNVFSYFQGYDFNIYPNYNEEYLESFLDYVKNIICSRNEEIYNWVISWISYIFKYPTNKTKTAIILIGKQGDGKNTFCNIICHLLGKYANSNCNIDNITGHKNNSILNKKLIICNEVEEKGRKDSKTASLKKLITEKQGDIDGNYQKEVATNVENVANLIILSNSEIPIKIEQDDRRYLVLKVSDEVRNDNHYFEQFQLENLEDIFFDNLLTYLINLDISNWDMFNPPMTEMKQFNIKYMINPYEIFVQQHKQSFKDGFEKDEAFHIYGLWRKCYGDPKGTIAEFHSNILHYCKYDNRKNHYKLKPGIFLN